MTAEELNKILADHALWLEDKGGKKADLQWADLRGAQLQRTDLQGAQLQWAQLQGADLQGAQIQWAQLQGADLQWAQLQGAQLQGADLQGAQLQWAQLQGADLQGAQLLGAQLQEADLRGAQLQGAQLQWAQLQRADLRGADVQGAAADALTAGFWPVCPEEGSFTAFKKLADGKIAKLFIPEHAKRSSATTRKCRCSEALVVEIQDRYGNNIDEGFSKQADRSGCELLYKVGHTVYPDGFDDDRWDECSNGIHFFMTRREAELY